MHGVYVGGSTLVRDNDGHVRNAFFLVGSDGDVLGRHHKDMPMMWENALYIGGERPRPATSLLAHAPRHNPAAKRNAHTGDA
jgi:hypothetical protein